MNDGRILHGGAESQWWDSLEGDDQSNNAYGVPTTTSRRSARSLSSTCRSGRTTRRSTSGVGQAGWPATSSPDPVARWSASTWRRAWSPSRGAGGPGTYLASDGASIPVDGPFDAACAVTVFQHIRHDIVRSYMHRTLERLVPGGRLLFSFADGDEDHFLSHQATAVSMMGWMYEAGFGNVHQVPTPADHPAWSWMIGEVPA